MSRLTGRARSFVRWCKQHPLPSLLALGAAIIIALFAIAQGVDWVVGKLDPPRPKILTIEEKSRAGGNFAVTIENPTDLAMVVTEAVFRAEPPPDKMQANYVELMIPAVIYEMPFDCSPGTKRLRLKPPFKIPAKDVGAVVFRSTVPMTDCQLFISLKTSQGQTKEQQAESLTAWQSRAP